jgi:FKBP-type peptidyl-prolyl cis-trans isomerase SlyD
MKIEQNKVVSLSYELKSDGEVIEVVTGSEPMKFLFGSGYLLPKFEENIANMTAGDKFDFVMAPADAYGEINEEAILELPKSVFEINGQFDDENVVVGENLPMRDEDGNRLYGTVEKIEKDTVTMNFNHPMAGCTLHFSGKIESVRDALPEDFAGGCGCDCDCDCDDDCNSDNRSGCGCNCCG